VLADDIVHDQGTLAANNKAIFMVHWLHFDMINMKEF
jgi:hypothetical protein